MRLMNLSARLVKWYERTPNGCIRTAIWAGIFAVYCFIAVL